MVILQETRTPVVSKTHRSVQHVVLLKNDFFGRLLLVRRGTPVPSSLGPGDTATLSLPTPALESARKTRYRFQYGGGPQPHARPRPRRGRRVPAGRTRPSPFERAPA